MIIFLWLGVLAFYFLVKAIKESSNPKRAFWFFIIFLGLICSFLEAMAKGLALVVLIPICIGVLIFDLYR